MYTNKWLLWIGPNYSTGFKMTMHLAAGMERLHEWAIVVSRRPAVTRSRSLHEIQDDNAPGRLNGAIVRRAIVVPPSPLLSGSVTRSRSLHGIQDDNAPGRRNGATVRRAIVIPPSLLLNGHIVRLSISV